MTLTILITGATSGLGLEAARVLARGGHRLIVGARSPGGSPALRDAVPAAQLTVLPLDTSALDSVHAFTRRVRDHLGADGRLDAVALNAGLQFAGPMRRSADGHELTFATNHLGHFLLTHALLDRLSPGAAVVSTASGTHDPDDSGARRFGFRGGVFPDAAAVARGALDPGASETQLAADFYATSKLCGILFTYGMARRVAPGATRFVAFDPGLMPGTGLARDRGLPLRLAWTYVVPLMRFVMAGVSSAARSGASLAAVLTEPRHAPESGAHLDFHLRHTGSSRDSHRLDWQDDLYETSAALTGTAGLSVAASA